MNSENYMNSENLEVKFIHWIEEKSGKIFPINNSFLLVCLDENIEQTWNSTINGVPFINQYPFEELMLHILQGWKSTVTSFLQLARADINITFRGEPIPAVKYREGLINQLNQLVSQLT